MGSRTRGREQDEVLRRRILDAAEEIVVSDGARHATMRRIAAAVGYAQTVLYRLFDDKADLMDHLIMRGYEGVRERYAAVLARPSPTAVATLGRLLEAYADYALEHPNHYRMWFNTGILAHEDGVLTMRHGRLAYTVFEAWLDGIEACRAEGMFAGRATLDVFQALWAVAHGGIALRLQHPDMPWRPLEKDLREFLAR